MELFPGIRQDAENLLPYDGVLQDFGMLFASEVADCLLEKLLSEVPWQHDRVRIGGRVRTTARQVAWYGETDFSYTYSGIVHQALPWTDTLSYLRYRVEERIGMTFNSCLLNLYHDGSTGMSWHQDSENTLSQPAIIVSLSLGATRRFVMRHLRSQLRREISLCHGQLILMAGQMQRHWQHAVPKQPDVMRPRVNLTFRQFSEPGVLRE